MIKIHNAAKSRIDRHFLEKVAKIVLKGENKQTKDISIVLVGSSEIKKLNARYRKKYKPTDVLSFNYRDLGEIALCLEEIKKNAKKFDSPVKNELARVLIHGILHLFGYDHEKSKKGAKKMREKEDFFIKKLFK